MEVRVQLLVVKARQQMMFPVPQRDGSGDLVINIEALQIFIRGIGEAVKLVDLAARPGGIGAALVGVHVKIARFLIKAPATVKLVLKAVAQHPLALLKPSPFISGVITAIGIFRAQIRQRERI